MDTYIIWTPIWISLNKRHIKLLISLTEFSQEGIYQDNKFIRKLCKTIKIREQPTTWELKYCRSRYFSEYPDSKDWRDEWCQLGLLEMDFSKKLDTYLAKLEEPWITRGVLGNGDLFPLLDSESAHCLIVGDFGSEDSIKKLIKTIKEMVECKKNATWDFLDKIAKSSSWKTPIKKGIQIIFDLGVFSPMSYSKGIEAADILEGLIQEYGGKIHHFSRI